MKLLSSPFFWIVLAIGLPILYWREIRSLWRMLRGKRGFKDLVRNPNLVEEWNRRREEERTRLRVLTDEARNWSEAQLREEVRRFLFDVKDSNEAWVETRLLTSLAERIALIVLSFVADDSCRNRLLEPTSKGSLPETPFHRACMLLREFPIAACVPHLATFLREPTPRIRCDAADVIGAAGTEEIIPHIRTAFADQDRFVVSYAIMGLGRAVSAGRLSSVCRVELFPDILRLVHVGPESADAARLLMSIDRDKASMHLLEEIVAHPGQENLHNALDALNGAGVSVPRAMLLARIAELERPELDYPANYALAAALRLLACHQHPGDLPLIERLMSHGDEEVAGGAADALLRFHGLSEAFNNLWGSSESPSPGKRATALGAVLLLDAEVKNGGFDQYFFNSSGDQWKEAVEGFEAVGSVRFLPVLRKAIDLFGPDGPSTDRSVRGEELARIARKQPGEMDKLADEYYAAKEVLGVLIARFMVAHKDEFLQQPESSAP